MSVLNKFNIYSLFIAAGFALLLLQAPSLAVAETADNKAGCLQCHVNKNTGFSDKHTFAARNCTSCHKGDDTVNSLPQAHEALIAFPGDMKHAETACGTCHAKRVSDVTHSLMNTGKGIVDKTRHSFDEKPDPKITNEFKSIGLTPADSLLRKLCTSCHLGNSKSMHTLDVTSDRGGGCSACHINSYPKDQHPALTSLVEDGRCFGCHSRSGRISLNYAGLAEIIPSEQHAENPAEILQLTDGRTVVKRPADVHHEAGMSCIDCHTSTGLMGGNDNTRHQQQAVDIRCTDCHKNEAVQVNLGSWPEQFDGLKQYLTPDTTPDQLFLATAHSGTPLWHINLDENGIILLQPKLGGPALQVPSYTSGSHPLEKEHARLHCSACHSQWAPQCYGCHIEYDPNGIQKDHLLQKKTPGRWKEQRWDVRSGLPPLGISADNTIRPFVPGMIMSIKHPDWKDQKFIRQFASTAPHTTGKSRSCYSCHRSSTALGLGLGKLGKSAKQWAFTATHKTLADGLPTDAWSHFNGVDTGFSSETGSRPFKRDEMLKILETPITK